MDALGKFLNDLFGIQFSGNAVYAIVGIAALFVLLIVLVFRMIWISMVNRRVRNAGAGVGVGMSMMDIDRMRKKGIIDEAEYRRIRSALAHHEVARSEDQQRIDQDRRIIAQIETNPEMARKLIEPRPGGGPRPALDPVAPSAAPPGRPGALAEPSYPVGDPGQWSDPLARTPPPATAQAPAAPPQPAVQTPPTPGGTSKPSDLDLLLAKGAISKEEYARLKKFTENA